MKKVNQSHLILGMREDGVTALHTLLSYWK